MAVAVCSSTADRLAGIISDCRDSIFTIGFPNADIQGTEPKLTKGEISSLAGLQDDLRDFQTSAPVQPGSAGGPLTAATVGGSTTFSATLEWFRAQGRNVLLR
jgi:hypothetical protein